LIHFYKRLKYMPIDILLDKAEGRGAA